jgi:hypothetical protein
MGQFCLDSAKKPPNYEQLFPQEDLYGGKSVRHDYSWHLPGTLVRQIMPTPKRHSVLRLEFDVLSHSLMRIVTALTA